MDYAGIRDLECSLLVQNAIELPKGKLLDRQGYGGEFYRSRDGKVCYPTATELLKLRVPSSKRNKMPKKLSKFYTEQNALIDDLIRMEQFMHSITADIRNDDKSEVLDSFHYHNAILRIPINDDDGGIHVDGLHCCS